MTYEEAIETIKIAIAEVEWNYPMEYSVAFEKAIEALEKQQTTKYKHLGTRLTHWGKCRHDKFMCETCGFIKEFTNNHTSQYQYCPSCGQAIDFGKE